MSIGKNLRLILLAFVCLNAVRLESAFGHFACVDLFSRSLRVIANPAAKSDQDKWAPSRFTDARLHRAEKYRYIVHAVRWPGNLRNAEDLIINGKLTQLSASIINQYHTQTFGDVGFILSVPKEAVVSAAQYDLHSQRTLDRDESNSEYEQRFVKIYRALGLPDPNKILSSPDASWNEVFYLHEAQTQSFCALKEFFSETLLQMELISTTRRTLTL